MKKTILYFLLIAGMVMNNSLRAQAQVSDTIVSGFIEYWNDLYVLDPNAVAEFQAGVTSNDRRVQQLAIEKYTQFDKGVEFEYLGFLVPTNLVGTEFGFREVEKDTAIDLYSVKVEMLSPNEPGLRGKLLPFMTYDPRATPQVQFIGDWKFKGEDGLVAKKEQVRTDGVAPGNNPSGTGQAGPSPGQPTGSITMDNGVTYELMTTSKGVSVMIDPLTGRTYAQDLELAKQAKTPVTPADSTTKSYTLSVAQSGDPDVLASLGSGGKTELAPRPIFEKRTVNGIETEYLLTPPAVQGQSWTVQSLDQNTVMAVVHLGNRTFLTSSGQAELADRKGANLFGMRGASGTDGNKGLGRHGGTWTGKGNAPLIVRGNSDVCCDVFRLSNGHNHNHACGNFRGNGRSYTYGNRRGNQENASHANWRARNAQYYRRP